MQERKREKEREEDEEGAEVVVGEVGEGVEVVVVVEGEEVEEEEDDSTKNDSYKSTKNAQIKMGAVVFLPRRFLQIFVYYLTYFINSYGCVDQSLQRANMDRWSGGWLV